MPGDQIPRHPHPADLVLRGGRSVSGEPLGDVAVTGGRIARSSSGAVVDIGGLMIAPGFVDGQVNGAFGHDFTTDPGTIWDVGSRLPGWGVTAFLPTLVSTTLDRVADAMSVVVAGPPPGYSGSALLGLHVEGPFLAPSRHGAHDPALLRHPAPELVAGWSPTSGVRVVTLAPELPGALATIATLAGNGVVVSLGHSNATFEEAMAGFDAGATLVTHLYNAMSGIGHRSPGLAAAALAHPTAVAGLIADGHHVHAGAVRAARAALGPDRIALVTDAIAATASGASDMFGGEMLGSVAVTTDTGAPRTADGTLAGSLLTTDLAVRMYRRLAGVDIAEAIAAATATPARVLGLGDRGSLDLGSRADVVLLDGDLEVIATLVAGKVVHGAARLG